MSNFPRFGRPRQSARPSVVALPFPIAVQPAAEPKPIILPFSPAPLTLQPVEPNPSEPAPASPLRKSPRRVLSPAKKATSLSASPKYEAFATHTTVASPPPLARLKRSPPVTPGNKYSERRNGETTPTRSPAKSRRAITPPLSPLALPRTQLTSVNDTNAQSRNQPEVEQKTIVYNKTVDKPAKYDRPSEYVSGNPHQKQQPAEVINLSGHNIGAVMEINKSSTGHRLGGETVKNNETEVGGRHGNEEKKTGAKKKELPMTAFMNSNFQRVNNSVLYDSACNHRDPGLHLAFSDAADGDGATADGHKDYKP